jgi:hypothetical protein
MLRGPSTKRPIGGPGNLGPNFCCGSSMPLALLSPKTGAVTPPPIKRQYLLAAVNILMLSGLTTSPGSLLVHWITLTEVLVDRGTSRRRQGRAWQLDAR